jgi:hypothetical protein
MRVRVPPSAPFSPLNINKLSLQNPQKDREQTVNRIVIEDLTLTEKKSLSLNLTHTLLSGFVSRTFLDAISEE